jgi:hypothetical protein
LTQTKKYWSCSIPKQTDYAIKIHANIMGGHARFILVLGGAYIEVYSSNDLAGIAGDSDNLVGIAGDSDNLVGIAGDSDGMHRSR